MSTESNHTEQLNLRDPKTLFKLWKDLTGEDLLNDTNEKNRQKEAKVK